MTEAVVRRAPYAVEPGNFNEPWVRPDGTGVGMDWIQAYINQGFGFRMNIGSFSTPIVGGGNGTIVDLDQPEGYIAVPSGSLIFPYRISIQTQVPLLAADSNEEEVIIAVEQNRAQIDDAAGAGRTLETAFNVRTNHPRTSSCLTVSAVTGDLTVAPTHHYELDTDRLLGDVQGTAANALWSTLKTTYQPRVVPPLYGPCSLFIYWGGTVAISGFAQVEYLEFPVDLIASVFGGVAG